MAGYQQREHPKSPPPSYSASDPAAGSSRDPPPPYNPNPAGRPGRNERTPLIIHRRVVAIRQSSSVTVSYVRESVGVGSILLNLAAVALFAYVVWSLATWWLFGLRNPALHKELPTYNVAIIGMSPYQPYSLKGSLRLAIAVREKLTAYLKELVPPVLRQRSIFTTRLLCNMCTLISPSSKRNQ